MPRPGRLPNRALIRFLRLRCGCGVEYKVRIERIAEGAPFECLSCGATVEVRPYSGLLELLHRSSELVLKLEEQVTIDGDTATPLSPVSRAPSVWS